MSGSYPEVIPGNSVPTGTLSSSEGESAVPQTPISSSSSSSSLRALPRPPSANTGPSPLTCPVSRCQLVFRGEMPHRDFRRHLKHPGLHERTGDEKFAWINLHKAEYDRLLAALGLAPHPTSHNLNSKEELEVSQADGVAITELEDENNTEKERKLRAAEFELRAKDMGITGEKSVAGKVAIWEGMWIAEQTGNDIQVITPRPPAPVGYRDYC